MILRVILRHHTKTMGMDIELTRAFGSIDMKAAIDQITEEFQKMIAKQKDPVRKEALRKEMPQALKDVRGCVTGFVAHTVPLKIPMQ